MGVDILALRMIPQENVKYRTVIVSYLQGKSTLSEVIKYFSSEIDSSNQEVIKIARINSAELANHEVAIIIHHAMLRFLKQNILNPQTCTSLGYEWVRDVLYPAEAPNEILLTFVESINNNNYVVGQPAGSTTEELIGLYASIE